MVCGHGVDGRLWRSSSSPIPAAKIFRARREACWKTKLWEVPSLVVHCRCCKGAVCESNRAYISETEFSEVSDDETDI